MRLLVHKAGSSKRLKELSFSVICRNSRGCSNRGKPPTQQGYIATCKTTTVYSNSPYRLGTRHNARAKTCTSCGNGIRPRLVQTVAIDSRCRYRNRSIGVPHGGSRWIAVIISVAIFSSGSLGPILLLSGTMCEVRTQTVENCLQKKTCAHFFRCIGGRRPEHGA